MPERREKTIGTLVTELTQELRLLFRQELNLFNAELKEKMAAMATDMALIGLGVVMVYFGSLVLLAALVLGLAVFLPAWGAALLVAAAFIGVGVILVLTWRKNLVQLEKKPAQTMESLKETVQWANIKFKERESAADALREQIRHTESDITETIQTLEQRLSPSYLRRRGVRNTKRLAWQGTAKLLDLAQRASVQASLIGGSALWIILRNRAGKKEIKKTAAKRLPALVGVPKGGGVAAAAGATSLWMLLRKGKELGKERETLAVPGGMVLAAAATKAFLSGVRSSKKSGTTRSGRKVAWRGLATAIGAALGSFWYSHKERRV